MAIENDDQLVERIVPKILASIRSKAKAVESIDIKADLTGITSIPCYDTSGGIFKQVLVDVNALKEPALSSGQAAEYAAQQATQATERANVATISATDAAQSANDMAEAARLAAEAANEFAGMLVPCSEDENKEWKLMGAIDDSKIYLVYNQQEQE